MALDEQIVEEIVRRVTRAMSVERIILFGSAARGEMTRDSDIDILVLRRVVEHPNDEWLCIQKALKGLGYPVDVILMNSSRYEDTKGVVGGIAFPANKEGRVIYDAA
jgi:predicted nucleotidyltransferase